MYSKMFKILLAFFFVYQIQSRSLSDDSNEVLELAKRHKSLDNLLSLRDDKDSKMLREIEHLITKLSMDVSSEGEKTEKKAELTEKKEAKEENVEKKKESQPVEKKESQPVEKKQSEPVAKKEETKQEEKKVISNDDMNLKSLIERFLHENEQNKRQKVKKTELANEKASLKEEKKQILDEKKQSLETLKKKADMVKKEKELRDFGSLLDDLKSQLNLETKGKLAKKTLAKDYELNKLQSLRKKNQLVNEKKDTLNSKYISQLNNDLKEEKVKKENENDLISRELFQLIKREMLEEQQRKKEEALERKMWLLLREQNRY